jgi:hypothetical protein
MADKLIQATRVDVTLNRSSGQSTSDQALWVAIRNRTNAVGFDRYSEFIKRVLVVGKGDEGTNGPGYPQLSVAEEMGDPSISARGTELDTRPALVGVDSYQLLKLATQAFLLFESGVAIVPPRDAITGQPGAADRPIDGEATRGTSFENFESAQAELANYLGGAGLPLPYLRRIAAALLGGRQAGETGPFGTDILKYRLSAPSMLELIWAYWHEQGMLVQSMYAILLRFQNRRNGLNDQLKNLTLDPLRPLSNLLWGFLQDEPNRLTVMRRAYEYDHEYGLSLQGKAVGQLTSVDSRSRFIEAFHNLLYRAAMFYREDADTTLISDGFALLNSLREVHVILAEGNCNLIYEMQIQTRQEMLIMQWLLARPEMREFLGGRPMVPTRERWMGQVDSMKRLQGWTDVGVQHFRDLGTFGEQLLLSIRYGDWVAVNDQEHARNWARSWRPEVQSYLHAYLAVTGVDLAAEMTDSRRAADRYVQPSIHLRNRVEAQGQAAHSAVALPRSQRLALPPGDAQELMALPAPVTQAARSRWAARRR